MRDRDIDDVLKRAAAAAPEVDSGLLDRVARSIGAGLSPVRPLPPPWILVTALIAVLMSIAFGGGIFLGLHGIHAMSVMDMALIFPVLAILIGLAAAVSVGEMIPGSRHRMAPAALLETGCVAVTVVFALLFHNYRVERFVPQGIACLTAGLALAVPTAVAGWLILHRGFAVESLAAGIAQGTLAGLAGLGMLELHCPNFEAPHVMVWHTGVLLLSGAAGALIVWVSRSFSSYTSRR